MERAFYRISQIQLFKCLSIYSRYCQCLSIVSKKCKACETNQLKAETSYCFVQISFCLFVVIFKCIIIAVLSTIYC